MGMGAKWLLAAVAVCAALPAAASADKMDKEDKKWLDSVRPIMLPEEEKTYRELKDSDRAEFQKIFWKRRDPDLETDANEYEAVYREAFAEANERFRVMGQDGAGTDCGRVFILLGEPQEVSKDTSGAGVGGRFPEVWTYRDRPGQTFQGGEAKIAFDPECRALASAVREQLDRVAEGRIAHPNIDYRRDKDGRLTKLVEQLPKPTPAQALLKTPRQDFPVAAQAEFLKVADGGTALLGLVRGDASGLSVAETGGKKVVKLVIAANAINEAGKISAFAEHNTTAEVQADGWFVASFRMGLKPGKYTLNAGALDEKNGKGSLTTLPVDVPDLNTGELSMASLIILDGVDDVPEGAPEDSSHPYAAFLLGRARLLPKFGYTFSNADALSFFYQIYDLKVDEASGKASGVASLSLLKKEGKTAVARAPEQAFESPVAGSVVGPVPLEKYPPGPYLVQLKVKDKLADTERIQEVPFEIKP